MGDMSAERLFLDHLLVIDRIILSIARRQRLTKEEAEDFASVVKVKLIANDYEVLRSYQGLSSLPAYLAAVIQRAYIDHCNHIWGKWRPSATAKRLGPLAVRLDQLLHRDGLTLEEACAQAPTADRSEIERIAALLPSRVRRKSAGEESLQHAAAADNSPEEQLLEQEREEAAEALKCVLSDAIAHLPDEDRLLVQLRLYDGVTLASISRALGQDARQLYRRWENLLHKLRNSLEEKGYDAQQVAWALETREPTSEEPLTVRPSSYVGSK